MHQVVTAQLAARALGHPEHQDPCRGAGGGAKPYRQKGTGRARQGSIRAPHFAGGGVALGPKPRSYARRTPRKMVQLALRCALSDRAAEGRVRLVDSWAFEVPKTKDALGRARRARARGQGARRARRATTRSPSGRSRTCPTSTSSPADQLTAYDVLVRRLWSCSPTRPCPGEVDRRDGAGDEACRPTTEPRADEAERRDEAEADAADDADAAEADRTRPSSRRGRERRAETDEADDAERDRRGRDEADEAEPSEDDAATRPTRRREPTTRAAEDDEEDERVSATRRSSSARSSRRSPTR